MQHQVIMFHDFINEPFHSDWTRHFCPDDIFIMRQAFKAACTVRPHAARTEDQRLIIAKAVMIKYQPLCSAEDLASEALELVA